MIAVCIGLFLWIRRQGEGLIAPAPPDGGAIQPGAASSGGSLLQVLVALVSIIVVSRALGWVFKRFHQPAVIGEVIAGILLGPSLLGWIAPELSGMLFPARVTPLLGVIAQLGVLLFMFLVGLELNTDVLREKTHVTVAISHASIVTPFILGSALALWLYPTLSTSNVSFTAFSLFLGISMSVTAFPVLARILTDRGMQGTRMGIVALTCAAVDDATAWCLLAFVVGVTQARVWGAGITLLLTLVYIVVMFAVLRPLVLKAVARWANKPVLDQPVMAVICVVMLLSSLATEFIGIHTLFGAFLFGAIIPHDSVVARTLHSRLQDFVIVLLLPAFFAFTGLRTQIGLIHGDQWLLCGLITLTACVGKFGGTIVAARLTGMGWRDSASVGILMNTRGLMELIVLNIGLDLGVISPRLFAMLVLMAVITTLATTPILDLLSRKSGSGMETQTGAA